MKTKTYEFDSDSLCALASLLSLLFAVAEKDKRLPELVSALPRQLKCDLCGLRWMKG